MSYVFEQGDYIAFAQVVVPRRDVGHRTDPNTGRLMVVPSTPEQVIPQSGQGVIDRIQPEPRKIRTVERLSNGDLVERVDIYRTATVAAGKALGRVCAVLDDAVLTGKPLTLDLDMGLADAASTGPGMYGTDAKGGA